MTHKLEEKLKENLEEKKISIDPNIGNENSLPEINAGMGWTEIPVQEFPSRGMFYPRGTIVKIKSPRTSEIKNYSTMDESSPSSIERAIDEIMYGNCNINFNNGQKGTSKDLTHFDKIHVLFLIREKAMMNYDGKKRLTYTVTNPKNIKDKKDIEISHTIFRYYEIKRGIMKHYSEAERCISIQDGEGENKIALKFYIPTVGVIQWIKNFIRDKEIQKQQGVDAHYDHYFLKVLQYITPNHKLLSEEDYYKNQLEWYDDLSLEENEILVAVIDAINIGIKPNIVVKFESGEEASVPVNFQSYKSLFSFSNRTSKLLSDTD